MSALMKTITSRKCWNRKILMMKGWRNSNIVGTQVRGLVILLMVQVSRTACQQNSQGFSGTTERTDGPPGVWNHSCAVPSEGSNSLYRNLERASEEDLAAPEDGGGTRDFCSSVVTYINNRARYMLHQAKFLTDVAMEDNGTFEMLKEEFKIELARLTVLVEDLYKDHETEVAAIRNEFRSHFIEFRENITDSLDQIEDLVVRKKESICVSEIRNGNYRSAQASFKKLGDDSKFAKIVTEAYSGDIEKLPNVLKFIKIAGSCENQALAYQTLFDIIKRDNRLSHRNVFFFSDLIEDCASASLKEDIKGSQTKAVDAFMFEFRLEKVFDVLEFEKTIPEDEVSVRFGIYSKLFDELESRNHSRSKELLALAYRVKLLGQFCEANPDDCKHLEQKLWDFERKFPRGLIDLLFSGSSILENMGRPPYFLHSISSGRVLFELWKDYHRGTWRVKPLKDSYFVELENWYNNRSLFVEDSLLYAGPNPGRAGHWELIPAGDHYFMRNREHGILGLSCTESRGDRCVLRCFNIDVSNNQLINFFSRWKFNG